MYITKITYYGRHVYRRVMNLEELHRMVKGDKVKEKVLTYRKKWLTTLPSRRNKLGGKLPRIIFGGKFDKNGMVSYSGLVMLSILCIGKDTDVEKLREEICSYPYIAFAMIGAEGVSVNFVVPFTRPDGTLPQDAQSVKVFHAHACRQALETFEALLHRPVELVEPDVENECVISYDPGAYYNPEAIAIHLKQPTGMPDKSAYQENFTKLPREVSGLHHLYEKHREISLKYEMIFHDAAYSLPPDLDWVDFKPFIEEIAKRCFKEDIGEEECTKWTLMRLGEYIGEHEIRLTIRNVYMLKKGLGTGCAVNKVQLMNIRLEEFMTRRYELRFNTMINGVEFRERDSFCFQYKLVDDTVINSIALSAGLEGLEVWDKDVRRYVKSDRAMRFSPVEHYLENLPAWDGRDRIRQLAARIPCDNPQWCDLFYIWMLSMVAHWLGRDKEHGNSLSPLLVGGQGCGKSTFCRNILPPDLLDYFTDRIDFGRRNDAELYLMRFALINIDEFDQVSINHQGFLKHLLQKTDVKVRKPYSSNIQTGKRYASFIATSNHLDLLTDSSGSRRFICIEVTGMIDNGQPVEYDQLYAQALAAVERGERYWLTPEEEKRQMAENGRFNQHPVYEDLFYSCYRPAQSKADGVAMTAGEIYQSVQTKTGKVLPDNKVSLFGRFLRSVVPLTKESKRGTMYYVVELG